MIAAFCTLCSLQAQQAATYTLKSCLEQGLLNNYSLRITHNEEQISKNNATLANAGALPTIDRPAHHRLDRRLPGHVRQHQQHRAEYWCYGKTA